VAHLSKFELQVCLIPLFWLYSNSLVLGQGIFLSRRDMYRAHLHLKLVN
jgi:hypothetical protein